MNLREIGRKCKRFRMGLGLLQHDVSLSTGYSVENVSSFETGRNDNMRILLWYFEHGMTYEYLIGGERNGA